MERLIPPRAKCRSMCGMDEVVLKALQEEPERRYQQVSELKSDVDPSAPAHQRRPAETPLPATPAATAAPGRRCLHRCRIFLPMPGRRRNLRREQRPLRLRRTAGVTPGVALPKNRLPLIVSLAAVGVVVLIVTGWWYFSRSSRSQQAGPAPAQAQATAQAQQSVATKPAASATTQTIAPGTVINQSQIRQRTPTAGADWFSPPASL